VNSWVFGGVCDDLAKACVPEQAGSSRLQAVFFTSPPPTLRLAGDIDEWTFPDLTEILARTAAAGVPRIHVDLADVGYCDVAGLRAMISLASGGGDHRAAVDEIVFAHLPGPLQRGLRILGWDAAPGVILEGSTCS
jgi:ABC-type transporter Mla MlaB component